MGVTLCRTGFSPNIKERLDYSCAIYDAAGETIAQGDHMPVHLGAMPLSVRAAIDHVPMEPGDVVVLNDPFRGGTHLPDITLVSPVFLGARERRPAFYVANRAHHSDVGGMSPGSMPLASEVFQEGLIIPPIKLVRRGEIVADVLALITRERAHAGRARGRSHRADCRESRRGTAAARDRREVRAEARRRLRRRGCRTTPSACCATRSRAIPDGEYRFEDALDDDGFSDRPVTMRAARAHRRRSRGGRFHRHRSADRAAA